MCEVVIEGKDLGKLEHIRIERNLFHYLTLCRLFRRVGERMKFELNPSNIYYVKDGQQHEFIEENWDDFQSSVVVLKKDNTKWGSFNIVLRSDSKKRRGAISSPKYDTEPNTPSEDTSTDAEIKPTSNTPEYEPELKVEKKNEKSDNSEKKEDDEKTPKSADE